jgi:teichuronic acid biosynthesis glycosyltransferase TuaC
MKILVATSIYPTNDNPALGSFVRTQVEYLKRAGVAVEVFRLQGRSRKWMYLEALFELRRRLSDPSIDLIHAHYSYVGMIARTQWKVPVVVSYCGDDILGTVNERGKTTFFSKLAVIGGRVLSDYVDAVIVKSREMANKLNRKDVYIIPHEIDFDVFQLVQKEKARALLGLDPRKKYLLFAANPKTPVKRFTLAKAVADEMQNKDPSVELLTVYKEPQESLALIMNACDALVFTSYQEGSPNVVKQAMACNLPIVSTDVGDVREILGTILGTVRGCYICEPRVAEFATCLEQILRSGERTTGREKVRHLSGLAVARKIIAVYENLVRKRKGYAVERSESKALAAEHEIIS